MLSGEKAYNSGWIRVLLADSTVLNTVLSGIEIKCLHCPTHQRRNYTEWGIAASEYV